MARNMARNSKSKMEDATTVAQVNGPRQEQGTGKCPPRATAHSHLLSKAHLKDAFTSATAFFSGLPRRLRLFSTLGQGHGNEGNASPRDVLEAEATRHATHETVDAARRSTGESDDDGGDMSQKSQKEQQLTPAQSLAISLSRLTVGVQPERVQAQKNLEIKPPNPPDRTPEERAAHERFTNEALDMARLALRTNETPVGCVLVHKGTVIAKGMNATNVTRNGTRHAEFMALSALFALPPGTDAGDTASYATTTDGTVAADDRVKTGHLFPYGQKLHPAPRVAKSIVKECDLYVTVEPCVMCASLLRQLGIRKVYFGAVNDKFGGTGGVFRIHQNTSDMRTRQADEEIGHGGNIEAGFEAEGGWGRDDAVGLLRRFYVQENGRAPVPRKKEGRAARLAALEREAAERSSMLLGGQTPDETHAGQDVHRNGESGLAPHLIGDEITCGPVDSGGHVYESGDSVSDDKAETAADACTTDENRPLAFVGS